MNAENNKIIAEFMGLKPVDVFGSFSISKDHVCVNCKDSNEAMNAFCKNTKYHSDWNWLMEVVEKIESFEDENRCAKFNVIIEQSFVEIIDCENSDEIVKIDFDTKIIAVYNACVQFVEWYNCNQQTDNHFEKHFEQAKKEILADIESGKIPSTVKSYWELNDYVDANCYGGFCEEGYEVSENFERERKVQDAVEEWLKERQ